MNRKLYRLLIKTVPAPSPAFGAWTGFTPETAFTERLLRVLRRERVQGGVLALTRENGEISAAAFGVDGMRDRRPASPEHAFRCASVSKFVTSAGTLRLAAAGEIDLDRDISEVLGYRVRHPKAPEKPITVYAII